MNSKIFLEDLKVHCIVGLLPFERITPQDVLVDLEMTYDFILDAQADDLLGSPSYFRAYEIIETKLQESQFKTLEAAAYNLCSSLFLEFPNIEAIKIRLKKPAAVPKARNSGVELAVNKNNFTFP